MRLLQAAAGRCRLHADAARARHAAPQRHALLERPHEPGLHLLDPTSAPYVPAADEQHGLQGRPRPCPAAPSGQQGIHPPQGATDDGRDRAHREAELLDKAEQRGSETIDLVNDVAVPLPLTVISTMLGVDDEDRDQFHVLVERFVVRLGSGSAADAMRAVPTARKLYAVLERLAEQRRAEPDDGLISALLEASEDGDSLQLRRGHCHDLPPHAGRARHDRQPDRELGCGVDRAPRAGRAIAGRARPDADGRRGASPLHDARTLRCRPHPARRRRGRRHDDAQGEQGAGHDHLSQSGRVGLRSAGRPRSRA